VWGRCRPFVRASAFAITGLLLGPVAVVAQPRYVVVNIGALVPDATYSEALGINASGKTAGSSTYAAGNANVKAVVADSQGMTALGSALGGPLSRAFAINDSDQSAGFERAPGATDNRKAMIWNGTVPTQLASLPQHTNARALDINASGVAVGQSTSGVTGGDGSRAVIWNGTTTPTDLGTLGGLQSAANAINDAGQVVGFSFQGDGSLRAVLWQNGTMVNLGSGANFSYATAINNKGQIVGASTGPFNARAYLWQNGTMTNLGTIGGGDSVAQDINDQGLIVGEYNLLAGGTRGAIWYMGEMFDVNTLLHSSSAGWTVETLQNVNEAGQIAGRACRAGVGCRAVRLEPRFSQYLAEGATSNFFDTQIALLNPGDRPTTATLTFQTGATSVQTQVAIPARSRATVNPKTLPGLAAAEFSAVVESDALLIVDRTMTWDATGYGAHAETAVSSPSTTWYLAEGATIGGFNLFYLIQNPSSQETRVRVRYLRTTGAPLEKEYALAPNSRTNIWVNVEEFPGVGMALASAELSAVVESLDNTPIIVERAMYLSNQGRTFNAGHESMGITTPNTQWFLAEGATGPYFDLFVLVANPTANDANVTVTYLLGDGRTFSRDLVAPANQRSGIWVDVEQFDGVPGFPLADVAVSTRVASTNNVPLIVERAMWWPGDSSTWHEAHNSAGSRRTGVRWALAEGEVGGARNQATYVLIANTSTVAGDALVTLLFEDGTTVQKTYPLAASSRTNVPVGSDFPSAQGRRFGVIVESTGTTPAQIVVERAMYSDAGGVTWAAGTNSLATRIP
jgi:probable HAF family extracellular repeat protein